MSDNEERSESLAGNFLISETELKDPNFYRTVVLMIDHNPEGAFGLVINRPSGMKLTEVVEDVESSPAGEIPVYIGGPVEQQYLFVLHSGFDSPMELEHEIEIVPSVYFHPLTLPFMEYLKTSWNASEKSRSPSIHIFAGYSGWGPGQLEEEIALKSWVTLKATPDIVFYPKPEEGWKNALSRKSDFYKIVAETGFKPSFN